MTRDVFLLGCHSYLRCGSYCTPGQRLPAPAQRSHGQSTTEYGTRQLLGAHIWALWGREGVEPGQQCRGQQCRGDSNDKHAGPPRKRLSFEMSESGHSDLITSPHRASGVAAIQDPAAQQAIHPLSQGAGYLGSREERSSRSVIPWPEHGPLPPLISLSQAQPSQRSSSVPLKALETKDDDTWTRCIITACACVQLRACAGTGCDCTFL